MSAQQSQRGRPRAFNTDYVIDRSMEVFWEHGFVGTTTRTLEDALEISQSSLYNAFGSKDGLFDQVVERYEQQLNDVVLSHLDVRSPDRASILSFLDAVTEWIYHDRHRGCLVLNLAAESEEGGRRVGVYRTRLRTLLAPAIASFTEAGSDVEARTELLVAAILGLNISSRSGADYAELQALSAGIRSQIEAW